MNDPGTAGYVAAYTRVLARGAAALFEETDDGSRLIQSFEITENLGLSHADAGQSTSHRWFSVLTACIELLGASVYRCVPLSATLASLLADTFALQSANVPDAPVDVLPRLFRELKEGSENPHHRVLALLSELIAAPLTDAEVEAGCRELYERHDEFQQWYREDGEQNHFYAERPEFVWGAVMRRAELPIWLELVENHFPRSPSFAGQTRERLLHAGEEWLRPSARTYQ